MRNSPLLLRRLSLAGCTSSGSLSSSTPTRVAAATPKQNAATHRSGEAARRHVGDAQRRGRGGGHQHFHRLLRGLGRARDHVRCTDHEMTNVYHMDGPTLVMTHYCAAGNQPRLRAASGTSGTIDFKTDSVTNWTAAARNTWANSCSPSGTTTTSPSPGLPSPTASDSPPSSCSSDARVSRAADPTPPAAIPHQPV